MLLGTDLEKPSSQLLAAYDDELGVTAAFNLNLLARVNRELGADFDLREFVHVAKINHEARSVEMHLQSRRRQVVSIPAAEVVVEFKKAKRYGRKAVTNIRPMRWLRRRASAGFRCEAQWIDEQWPFAENLLIAE